MALIIRLTRVVSKGLAYGSSPIFRRSSAAVQQLDQGQTFNSGKRQSRGLSRGSKTGD
ncbi:hypothetical protein FOXB_14112 [Fusarium oxysporum f. sp. conglutinans Fo5176]|uniref:Uncharacterized protein n=1 Tax=Fusarium oxysporum (strain Fo5176) TaxID=660025 RepID=F9G630_FUSOF|nr:hypothetical protein FOXB_14112 [Fusarium oxysporum f. sp. conglutinans Fo5176]